MSMLQSKPRITSTQNADICGFAAEMVDGYPLSVPVPSALKDVWGIGVSKTTYMDKGNLLNAQILQALWVDAQVLPDNYYYFPNYQIVPHPSKNNTFLNFRSGRKSCIRSVKGKGGRK